MRHSSGVGSEELLSGSPWSGVEWSGVDGETRRGVGNPDRTVVFPTCFCLGAID